MTDAPIDAADRTAMTDWPRIAPALLAAACFGVLAFALTAQYAFGYEPCELCTYQRFAYGMAGLLALSALMPQPNSRRQDLAVLLTGIVLLGGMGVAFYHVGVEHHWWGSAFCAPGATDLGTLSFQDLRSGLVKPAFKPCDEVDWTFLGLSMATYNVALFFVLGVAALATAWARFKKARP
jgi:disulfide bond formation protein DsbB